MVGEMAGLYRPPPDPADATHPQSGAAPGADPGQFRPRCQCRGPGGCAGTVLTAPGSDPNPLSVGTPGQRMHAPAAGAGRRDDPAAPVSSRLLTPDSPESDFVHDPAITRWLIDDCDRLDAARQTAAFTCSSRCKPALTRCWRAAGQQAPAQLPVMPELATRLGWGLVLHLKPLSDADTATALAATLAERGLATSTEVIPWLMTHGPRNLGHLRCAHRCARRLCTGPQTGAHLAAASGICPAARRARVRPGREHAVESRRHAPCPLRPRPHPAAD